MTITKLEQHKPRDMKKIMGHTLLKRSLKGALVIGGLCALIPSVYGQGIGLKKLDDMLTPTQTKLERGKTIYERQCVTCHGETGANNTKWAKENGVATGGFKASSYKNAEGGSLIQIYNTITKPNKSLEHPVYNYLGFQDRWAVSHYIQQLDPAKDTVGSRALVKEARFEAENGLCFEDAKASISGKVKPQGDAQLAKGKELYDANCASCHGEKGAGDGAAAAALNPPPRNFTGADAKWKNGTSPLGIFKTLANGIPGGSMASYAHLSEEERWALTHYVRAWVPEAKREESNEEQILAVCRTLSAPTKPEAIPVEMAMKFLVEDAPEQRAIARNNLGPVYRYTEAKADRGQELFAQNCASCHGNRGEGSRSHGPYGATPPFLYLSVGKLQNVDAAGSFEAFATRSNDGVHLTLGDMSGSALLSEQDWKDVQAYVATFDGEAQFIDAKQAALLNAPVLTIVFGLSAQGLTIDGEAVTLDGIGPAIEAKKGGKLVRVEAIIEAPQGVAGNTTVELIGALKAAGITNVATKQPTPVQPADAQGAPNQ